MVSGKVKRSGLISFHPSPEEYSEVDYKPLWTKLDWSGLLKYWYLVEEKGSHLHVAFEPEESQIGADSGHFRKLLIAKAGIEKLKNLSKAFVVTYGKKAADDLKGAISYCMKEGGTALYSNMPAEIIAEAAAKAAVQDPEKIIGALEFIRHLKKYETLDAGLDQLAVDDKYYLLGDVQVNSLWAQIKRRKRLVKPAAEAAVEAAVDPTAEWINVLGFEPIYELTAEEKNQKLFPNKTKKSGIRATRGEE